jgi:hypothetical protein
VSVAPKGNFGARLKCVYVVCRVAAKTTLCPRDILPLMQPGAPSSEPLSYLSIALSRGRCPRLSPYALARHPKPPSLSAARKSQPIRRPLRVPQRSEKEVRVPFSSVSVKKSSCAFIRQPIRGLSAGFGGKAALIAGAGR